MQWIFLQDYIADCEYKRSISKTQLYRGGKKLTGKCRVTDDKLAKSGSQDHPPWSHMDPRTVCVVKHAVGKDTVVKAACLLDGW